MTDTRRPLRLGFFTYLDGSSDAAESYRQAIELFSTADELGLDTGWVAQHHFGSTGNLPSPLLFLGTVAERTPRIGLGTAIVTLPLEHPLRVAEDAAVVESLHPGRLQLGLGTGGGDHANAAFGIGAHDRRAALESGYSAIRDLVSGAPVDAAGSRLHPAAPGLADRLWIGSGSVDGVRHAGSVGAGLLLSRVAWGPQSARTGSVQRPLVEQYADAARAAGHTPRVVVSRTIHPSTDRASAVAELAPGVLEFHGQIAGHGIVSDATSTEEIFAAHNIHAGHPDEIVASLLRDETVAVADELIFQVQPGQPGFAATLRTLATVATEIAPRLGWRPAGSPRDVNTHTSAPAREREEAVR